MDNKILNEPKRNNILNGECAVYKMQLKCNSEQLAPEYWHYTSLSALLSIFDIKNDFCIEPNLTRCEMLASNICYLNDIKEFYGGVNDFKKAIKAIKKSKKNNFDVKKLDVENIQDVSDDIYIISFCGHGDLLSNWKYYAKDSGISIEFDMENVGFKYMRYKKNDIIYEDWYDPIPVEFCDEDKLTVAMSAINNALSTNFRGPEQIKVDYRISRNNGYNELKIKQLNDDCWSRPIVVKINRNHTKGAIAINKRSVSKFNFNILDGLDFKLNLGDGCAASTPIVIIGDKCQLNRDDQPELVDEKSKPIGVVYDKKKKKQFIENLANNGMESASETRDNVKNESKSESGTTVDDKSIIKYIAIPCFKDQGFAEEKEHRLLFYKYNLPNDLTFDFTYNTNNPINIKPALRVQFISKTRLIKSIIVGPGENQNRVFNTLIHIFDSNNYKFYDDDEFQKRGKTIPSKKFLVNTECGKLARVNWGTENDEKIRWSYKCENGIIIMKSSIPFRG